jgi:2-polyprenyl-3-methyl-5-hydroxy-6-metoxy-1,4-benzoquinol methylase
MQKLSPDAYAELQLPDQHIEDIMQEYEAKWILEQTQGCNTILELGWGSGIIAKALHNAGKSVLVLDGSRESCHIAYQHHGIMSMQTMFADFTTSQIYDCVIASFVLEHVENPVDLLLQCGKLAKKLIVVVGNANSYHRQLAVQMGLQPCLDSLSARDEQVGHYRVYDFATIKSQLNVTGWTPMHWKGLQFKPLPNSMITNFDPKLIRAMCEIDVPFECAANLMIVCK